MSNYKIVKSMENENRITSAYRELIEWDILPSQELTKLMNVLIPIIDDGDNAQDYKKWFEKEKTHLFFALERIGELEKQLQQNL